MIFFQSKFEKHGQSCSCQVTQEQMVQEREREQGRDNKFINVLVMQTQLVVSENSVKMRQQLS